MSTAEDEICKDSTPSNISTPDEVMVANSKTGSKRKFHADYDCRYVTDSHREWDYDMALAWGWEACEECSAYLK